MTSLARTIPHELASLKQFKFRLGQIFGKAGQLALPFIIVLIEGNAAS